MKFKHALALGIICFIFSIIFIGCSKKTDDSTLPLPIKTTDTIPTTTPVPTSMPTTTPTNDAPMVPLIPIESEPSQSVESNSGSLDLSKLPGGILKLKMENGEVKVLQQRLKELGYLDKVTGYFGTDTEVAVKEFQKKNNLDADGIVGSGTWKIMSSTDAVSA